MTHINHQPLYSLYKNKYANFAYLGIIHRMIACARALSRSDTDDEILDLLYIDAALNVFKLWEIEQSLLRSDTDPRSIITGRYYKSEYKDSSRKVWLNAVIHSLITYARLYNDFLRYTGGESGSLLVEEWDNGITFKEKIERDYEFQMGDGAGVSLWSYANCHYVVAHGIAYSSVGYHAYNLYNYFARVPYLWNDYLRENGFHR